MKYCPACSAKVIPGARFCPSCGGALQAATPAPGAAAQRLGVSAVAPAPEKKKKSNLLVILVGVVVVIGAIGAVSGGGSAGGKSAVSAAPPASEQNLTLLTKAGEAVAQKDMKLASELFGKIAPVTSGERQQAYADLEAAVIDHAIGEATGASTAFRQINALGKSFESQRPQIQKSAAIVAKYETAINAVLKPLPASEVETSLAGYRLLAKVTSDKPAYVTKVAEYTQKKIDGRSTRVAEILKGYRVETDKFNNLSFYTHASSPRFTNSRSTVYLYIAVNKDTAWLRMKTTYASDDWLFVDEVQAFADGETSQLTSGDFERDNTSTIWEWMDEKPSDSQIATLQKLAGAKDATLRYVGNTYRDDITLGGADKKAILDVLETFAKLQAALSD